jgi:hypothetical protein
MAIRVKVFSVNNSIERGWYAVGTVYEDVESNPTPMQDFTDTQIPLTGPMTWENVSQQVYDFGVKASASRASTLADHFGEFYPAS